MKKFIICMLAVVSLASCYNKVDDPQDAYIYSDVDFTDCQKISIKELKDSYSHLLVTGNNELIEDYWYISGKVISTDEESSIYKSLYILDHQADSVDTRAIELRLFSSNYVSYPVGSMVYVKLNGLSIGDYGGMLSIGASSEDPDYPHTTIEGRVMLKEHIFLGEKFEMTSADTLVINKDNYETIDLANALGRLIRLEEIESAWGSPAWTTYDYPSYFSSSSNSFEWIDITNGEFATPTLSYYGLNPTDEAAIVKSYFYGSGWFVYTEARETNRDSDDNIAPGHFVTRISGYAKFRDIELPADGTKVNMTAILSQYGSSAYWLTYQLNLNHGADLVVVEE
ncbi:MAG: DUF5689 domain-containing protein [Rikenellaceae bacterium]